MSGKLKLAVITVLVVGTIFALGFWELSKSATSVSIIEVSDPDLSADQNVTVSYHVDGGEQEFSIVVLPDTQYYAQSYPEIFFAQTQWILENKNSLNIVFVSHVGDIVQNNDLDETEWQVADSAMSLLDDIVPYGILPGNHDMQVGGRADLYEKYFPASRFEHQSWWGGDYAENRNNYQLFSAGGDDYVILHLQYCPTDEVINWANEVLQKWSSRKAIISTHAYLLVDGSHLKNCQTKSDGDINGAQMFNKLVKRNPNVFIVLAGHIPGVGRREDLEGRLIYQLLADFQNMEKGGSGYLRIMNFEPQNDVIHISTFSPYLNEFLTDEENQFDLPFEMTGGTWPKGNVLVYSGKHFCIGTVDQGSCEIPSDTMHESTLKAVYFGDISHRSSVSSEFNVLFP